MGLYAHDKNANKMWRSKIRARNSIEPKKKNENNTNLKNLQLQEFEIKKISSIRHQPTIQLENRALVQQDSESEKERGDCVGIRFVDATFACS